MAICNPNCDVVIPPLIECPDEFRNGGISRLFFIPCWLEFYDIKDVAEWCEYYNSGLLVFTAPILGQKPKATMFKRRISSCNPEKVIGKTNSVKFQDFNADDVAFSDYDFWNTIMDNPHRYQMGFMDCNDLFYGFFQDIVLDIDDIIEDSSNGLTFWDGSIDWNGYLSTAPIRIPLLLQTLLGDCTNIPPSPPSCCKRWRPIVYTSVNIINSQVADVIVTFDECVDADSYTIEIIINGDPPRIFTGVTSLPYTITNVPQGVNYIVTIYSVCGNLESKKYSTSGNVPTWPCCAPLNGTNNFRIGTVTYSAPNFSVPFELDLATGACLNVANTFIAYQYGNSAWSAYQGPFVPSGNLVTGILTIPDIVAGQNVYFRYYNDCGLGVLSPTSAYSTPWAAPECCPQHRFNLVITQQVNATDVDVTVMWTVCSDALNYYIRYSENGGPFTSYQLVAGNSVTFNGLLQGADYEFEVYAECSYGVTPTSSKTTTTGVPPCCTVQSFDLDLANVVIGVSNFTVPYTLTQSSGICVPSVNVEFRWKRTSGGVFSPWTVISGGTLDIPISEAGHPLTIEVRNDCGGTFSNAFTSTTTLSCCPPTNFTATIVNIDANSVDVRLNWTPCFSGGKVEVTYKRNGDPLPINMPGSPFVAVPGSVISIPITASHTTIEYNARTQCSLTNTSGWVGTNTPINKPCCPPVLTPTPDTAVTKDPSFIYIPVNFTAGVGACDTVTDYTLEWRVAPSGVWNVLTNFISGSNIQVPITEINKTIDIRVVANCPSGTSQYSNMDSVYTGCCTVSNVDISVPSGNNATLNFDLDCASTDIEYYLWYDGNTTSVTALAGVNGVNITIPLPANIVNNPVLNYKIFVRSTCGTSAGQWVESPLTNRTSGTCCSPFISSAIVDNSTTSNGTFGIRVNFRIDNVSCDPPTHVEFEVSWGIGTAQPQTNTVSIPGPFAVTNNSVTLNDYQLYVAQRCGSVKIKARTQCANLVMSNWTPDFEVVPANNGFVMTGKNPCLNMSLSQDGPVVATPSCAGYVVNLRIYTVEEPCVGETISINLHDITTSGTPTNPGTSTIIQTVSLTNSSPQIVVPVTINSLDPHTFTLSWTNPITNDLCTGTPETILPPPIGPTSPVGTLNYSMTTPTADPDKQRIIVNAPYPSCASPGITTNFEIALFRGTSTTPEIIYSGAVPPPPSLDIYVDRDSNTTGYLKARITCNSFGSICRTDWFPAVGVPITLLQDCVSLKYKTNAPSYPTFNVYQSGNSGMPIARGQTKTLQIIKPGIGSSSRVPYWKIASTYCESQPGFSYKLRIRTRDNNTNIVFEYQINIDSNTNIAYEAELLVTLHTKIEVTFDGNTGELTIRHIPNNTMDSGRKLYMWFEVIADAGNTSDPCCQDVIVSSTCVGGLPPTGYPNACNSVFDLVN